MLDPSLLALLAQPTVTIETTARVLNVGRSSAYAAAAAGEIPTIRVGRRLLVPSAALRRMLQIEEPSTAGAGPAIGGEALNATE